MEIHRENHAAKASQHFTVMQVRALFAAAESRSFTKAAALLNVSQPALSRCIKEMEDALGIGLFQRSRHGVVLSPAGQAILPEARRLLDAYEGAHAFMVERRASRQHLLRVASDASITPVVCAPLQDTLKHKVRGLQLQLRAMGSEEAVNQVLERTADMALCGAMEGYEELRYIPLLQAQMGLMVPPGCVLPAAIKTLADLADTPLVGLAECTPIYRMLRREGVDFASYFEAPTVFTCLSAAFDLMREQKIATVVSGIGASLPPVRDMAFLPLPGLLPAITVYLVSLRKPAHDVVFERQLEWVRTSMHQSPWHPSVVRLNRMPQDGSEPKTQRCVTRSTVGSQGS